MPPDTVKTMRGRRWIVELARPYVVRYASGLEAYLALQLALMRRFVARGGTEVEWCARLAPAFRRRYGSLLQRS